MTLMSASFMIERVMAVKYTMQDHLNVKHFHFGTIIKQELMS